MARFATIAACALGLSTSGCRRAPVPPTDERSGVRAAPSASASVAPPDPSRLPEDPAAGRRSTLQWREHMEDEERERQLGFDHRHLKEHRAVVKLLTAARARYDGAQTEAAVERVRGDMPRQLTEIRRKVTELDHWGVNSRVLPDYAALEASLEAGYADAKVAALGGHAEALAAARATFDQHLKTIADWLEAANETEGDEH